MIRTLALLAFVATPVYGADLTVNENRVQDCHANTPEGERYPTCLGAASDDCQIQPNGDTTNGIAACIRAETAIWDDILNREYALTRDGMRANDASEGSDLAAALLKAQRAWIAFRDAECALTNARWLGGSVRVIAFANCEMVMTAERSLSLRDMRPK